MKSSFLGVLIALVGNSLIGTSFSVMKIAHERNTGGKNYLTIPMWWAGTSLMVLGELGNLVAYSLAKPSLISPLGAISVVVNVPFAYFILGEKLSFRNILGCILCILGGYGIVGVVANNTSEHETVTVEQFEKMAFRPTFMVFFTISVMESIDLIWSRRKTVMTYIWICSLLGGLTVLSIKAVTSFMVITFQGSNQFGNLLPFAIFPILALTLVLQVHFLNKAIADYGTGEVVPTYYVIFTSCAVLGSAILYGDLTDSSKENILVFLLSFIATSAGVYLVANQREGKINIHRTSGEQHIRSIEASDGDDQETLL